MAHEEQDGTGRRDRYAAEDRATVQRDPYADEDPPQVHPGWAHQPQTSYDAAHSGGWGGPGQAETGPLQLTGATEETDPYGEAGSGYARGEDTAYVEQESPVYGDEATVPYVHQDTVRYVDAEATTYPDTDAATYVEASEATYADAEATTYIDAAAEDSIYRSAPAPADQAPEEIPDEGEAYVVEPPSYGPQSSQHVADTPRAPEGADTTPPRTDPPDPAQGQGWFAYAPPSGPQHPYAPPSAPQQQYAPPSAPHQQGSARPPAPAGPRRGRGRGASARNGLAAVLDFSFAARATRALARPLFWLVVAYGVIEVVAVLVTLLSSPALGYSGGAVFFAFLQSVLDAAVKIALARLFLELCVNVSDLAERHAGRAGRADQPDHAGQPGHADDPEHR